MQRAQKAAEKSREEEYFSDDLDDDQINNQLSTEEAKRRSYTMNPSYQFCERLKFGRFSFQGMNLDIETLMYNNGDMNSSFKGADGSAKGGSDGGAQKRAAPPSTSSSEGEEDLGPFSGDELDDDEQ